MRIEPAVALRGALEVPGVKGICQRGVLFGAIADGVSEVRGFGRAADTESAISVARQLGVDVEEVSGDVVRIHVRGLRGLAVPVLEGALEHSLELAASMDSRGYGRRGEVSPNRRRVSQAVTLAGIGLLTVGVFAVLDSGAPFVLGIPMLALGALALSSSVAATKATATRSRYRPGSYGRKKSGRLSPSPQYHGLAERFSPLWRKLRETRLWLISG